MCVRERERESVCVCMDGWMDGCTRMGKCGFVLIAWALARMCNSACECICIPAWAYENIFEGTYEMCVCVCVCVCEFVNVCVQMFVYAYTQILSQTHKYPNKQKPTIDKTFIHSNLGYTH